MTKGGKGQASRASKRRVGWELAEALELGRLAASGLRKKVRFDRVYQQFFSPLRLGISTNRYPGRRRSIRLLYSNAL